ncbi:hypothetical protein NKH77_24660 [Streptomyces sp. M19]
MREAARAIRVRGWHGPAGGAANPGGAVEVLVTGHQNGESVFRCTLSTRPGQW